MKAMISQAMAGRTPEEIARVRDKATNRLQTLGYEIVDTYLPEEWHSKRPIQSQGIEQYALYFLAKALARMSKCNAVFFCKGWRRARGCRIEHEVAKAYGLTIIYE